MPFGVTNDWNFRAWCLLWPFYTSLWFFPGLQIAFTVPSMNPKQFVSAAPLFAIAVAYRSSWMGLSNRLFHCIIRWLWRSYTNEITSLKIIDSSGTGRPKRGQVAQTARISQTPKHKTKAFQSVAYRSIIVKFNARL